GGNPSNLSVQAVLPRFVDLATRYGSLTRGMLASRAQAAKQQSPAPLFRTIKGGLTDLVDAVARAIAAHAQVLNGRAETIERAGTGYRVRVSGEWIDADHVVLATEAHSAAGLVGALDA